MNVNNKISKLRFPSLKRYLYELNTDLTSILNKCRTNIYHFDHNLTLLEKYIITIEDRRFFHHRGVDFKALTREFLRGVIFRKPYGASTINMQFVRVCTGKYERSISRKLREAVLAYLINFHVDRITILRSYLNIAFFGSGMYGINAASHKLFSKSPFNLNHAEASFLAACLVNPAPLDKNDRWKTKVEARAKRAREQLSKVEKPPKNLKV